MENLSNCIIDIVDDMLTDLYEGEYDGCNGSWEKEMLFVIEHHPVFKKIEGYPKTPTEPICSMDILNIVKFVDMHRRVARDEAKRTYEKHKTGDPV